MSRIPISSLMLPHSTSRLADHFSTLPSTIGLNWLDTRGQLLELSKASLPIALRPYFNHPVLEPSKYLNEFEQISPIGKGAYGRVFKAVHKLANVPYAIKKIELGPNAMRKIETRGQEELDKLLNEFRTLACLDHPNIVRFHAGWLEFSHYRSPAEERDIKLLTQGEHDSEYEDDEYSHATDDLSSRIVSELSVAADDGIVFAEDSHVADSSPPADDNNDASRGLSNPRNSLQDYSTHSWITKSSSSRRRASQATVSSIQSRRISGLAADEDDDVETIERQILSSQTDERSSSPEL